VIKDDLTECYVLIEGLGDVPIGVQGWHHKTFAKSVSAKDILEQFVKDSVLWDMGAPE